MHFAIMIFIIIIGFFPYLYAKPVVPRVVDDGWDVLSPESVGLNASNLNKMKQMIRFKYKKIDSIIIVRNNSLVFEKYFNDSGIKKPHKLQSAGKSIISALVGIAMDQRKIGSVETSVHAYMPYKQYKNWDNDKKSLKLKHLLTMTTGWKCPPILSTKNCRLTMFKQKDPLKWLLDREMESRPGTQFKYLDAAPTVLRGLLLSISKDYYYQNLYKPLAIKRRKSVNSLTSRDMAKIGQLFLDKGKWKGKQIISQKWVEESTSVQFKFEEKNGFSKGYGYYWWIKDFYVGDKAFPSYFAAGNGGQYIIVFPTVNMVVVFTGHNYNEFDEMKKTMKLVEKYILTSIKHFKT